MGRSFAVSTCVHIQISGIPDSTVERQAQTSGLVLWAAKILLFMVPPCAISASVIDGRAKAWSSNTHSDHQFGRCEIGRLDHDLTRSNRRLYAGMSGEKSPTAKAKGGSQSAHRDTGKLSVYLEVHVRNLCS